MITKTSIEMYDPEIIEYINREYTVDAVYNDDEIISYVQNKFYPEDIYTPAELSEWAKTYGYIKEE